MMLPERFAETANLCPSGECIPGQSEADGGAKLAFEEYLWFLPGKRGTVGKCRVCSQGKPQTSRGILGTQ